MSETPPTKKQTSKQATATEPAQSEFVQDVPMNMDQLLSVLMDFRRGDFTVRLPATWTGASGRVADALNDILE